MFQIIYEGELRTRSIHPATHVEVLTDAPKDNHGKGELFSPTDLLAIAAGSCALTLMGIEAQRCGISLEGLKVEVNKEMVGKPIRKIGAISMVFYCPKSFDPSMLERLEKAAKNCPVHASLHPEIVLSLVFNWGI